ncbi:hypothetical protein M9H77_12981 [Catharanthus roseus]|uniref:Uncharacterized protein n=1 Tax=Catharanthus roseus TaxID=4058 RepID=A0ACC0BJ04_CATRO|nr:hypothetical protein M9H77_12981 [Catharanthus roseus]
MDTASCSAMGFGRLVESQEGLKTEVGPKADLIDAPGIPELGSDGLVLRIRTLSMEPHCCITCPFKVGRRSCADVSGFAQTFQLRSKPHIGSSISFVKIVKAIIFLITLHELFCETASSSVLKKSLQQHTHTHVDSLSVRAHLLESLFYELLEFVLCDFVGISPINPQRPYSSSVLKRRTSELKTKKTEKKEQNEKCWIHKHYPETDSVWVRIESVISHGLLDFDRGRLT